MAALALEIGHWENSMVLQVPSAAKAATQFAMLRRGGSRAFSKIRHTPRYLAALGMTKSLSDRIGEQQYRSTTVSFNDRIV
jgi:hypothetical protein